MNIQQKTQDPFPALVARYEDWLKEKALPLWWEQGADRKHGGFFDLLDHNGALADRPKRGRVQGRQSWVYALAGSMGWKGPWDQAARHGLDFLMSKQRRDDGQIATLMAADGSVRDRTATLYDQTFFLLALSEAAKVLPDRERYVAAAHRVMDTIIVSRRHPAGGFIEHAEHAFQSNPHMHLLEAMLAWSEVEPGGRWDRIADEVVDLALTRFVDAEKGCLREFFDAEWRPAQGDAGCSVEPGHQFEWAWLLNRWAGPRGHQETKGAARKLFEIGSLGVDKDRGVAIDELTDGFAVARATARLWPQTERIKAAAALMAETEGGERERYRVDAFAAANALWRYLEMPVMGLWRDRMKPDASFIDEPAPASSFYHIICAIKVMREHIPA